MLRYAGIATAASAQKATTRPPWRREGPTACTTANTANDATVTQLKIGHTSSRVALSAPTRSRL